MAVKMDTGQASLHHGRLFHSSGPNSTSDRRIGVAIRYVKPSMRQHTGERWMVRLACGEDRYGHFDLAGPPRGRLLEADFERCRRDAEVRRRQFYSGADPSRPQPARLTRRKLVHGGNLLLMRCFSLPRTPHYEKESIRVGPANSDRWPLPAWPGPGRIGLIELNRAPMEIGTRVWGRRWCAGRGGEPGGSRSKTRSGCGHRAQACRRTVGWQIAGS